MYTTTGKIDELSDKDDLVSYSLNAITYCQLNF